MNTIKIQQNTIQTETNPETIFEANGCAIVYAVYDSHYALQNRCPGFVVKSFVAKDMGKIVARGKDWADVRRKARRYCKENAQRHFDHHGIYQSNK